MLPWWSLAITAGVGFIAGWVVSWLFFRNNPKYLNIDKIIEAEIKSKRQAVITAVQEKVKEVVK